MRVAFRVAAAISGFALAGHAQQPSAAEQSAFIEKARQSALRYSEMLPNFVCTETIRRYAGDNGQMRSRDTLAVQLSYFEKKESYKLLVDGKPSDVPYETYVGATSRGEFGSVLRWIFEPNSKADFHWEKSITVRGTRASVYSYRITRDRSTYVLAYGSGADAKGVVVGLHGLLHLAEDSAMVLHLTAEAEDVPLEFPIRRSSASVDYAFTPVGGREYLLPVRAETELYYVPNRAVEKTPLSVRPITWRNSVEFGSYRKFTVDSAIEFGDGNP